MYVSEYFTLNDPTVNILQSMTPEFGYNGFGEVVFARTYSRMNHFLQKQETWADVVHRVVNGVFSIRKDWYVKNRITWDEVFWQDFARKFAISLFKMEWLPPGRGLWAMGTPFIYERGSMSLYNCAYTELRAESFAEDIEWMMDSLMLGVGVGFKPVRDTLHVSAPVGEYLYQIPDTKEGWAHAVRQRIEAFTIPGAKYPNFDFSNIRPEGQPIKGFGGLASGPAPLQKLLDFITSTFKRFLEDPNYDVVRLKTDIANAVGICVVAGNVRRSAEIAMGPITDQVFLDLKDYDKYPERREIGWMSNNTAVCENDEDFLMLDEIAKRVVVRGEPGLANVNNFAIGRVGKRKRYPSGRKDLATGLNPCGEITLEHRETCNVVETCPTRCRTVSDWYNACIYATLYSSTVSLLPTHQPSTNSVVNRNRRIGVGIVDGAFWIQKHGLHRVTSYLRNGYRVVRRTNSWANGEAGVPSAIKVTTIKPGGTVPKLVGGVGGIGFATFNHTLRRMRVAANNPIVPVLKKACVPWEPCVYDPKTLVFSFPTYQKGKPAQQVSLWEQAFNLITFQREWSDNAVSNTLYFKPKWTKVGLVGDARLNKKLTKAVNTIREANRGTYEDKETKFEWTPQGVMMYKVNPGHEEDVIRDVLAHIAPMIKSCSFLPHADEGVYAQMPEEGLTEREYKKLVKAIKPFDWSEFSNSDGQDERYCSGASCEVNLGEKQ